MRRIVDSARVRWVQTVDGRDDGEFAPLVVRGGGLHGVAHAPEVPSAQVKTALVLAGLQADGVTEIRQPAQSRDHTERMLGALGASIEVDGLVRAGTPQRPGAVRARRAWRSVVGGVLVCGGRDHARARTS